MNATVDLPSLAGALAARTIAPAWLADFRAQARQRLAGATFPGRKTESWKYSSPLALATSGALAAPAASAAVTLPASATPAFDAWRLVIVNGRLDAAQSTLPADGSLRVSTLVDLPAGEQAAARELLALADEDRLPFATLNSAAFADGIYVQALAGAAPARPLHVVFHATGATPATVQARLLVRVEPRATLTLIEQYSGDSDGIYTNAATSIDLLRDAQLTLVRVQREDHRQWFTGSLHVQQRANSRCQAHLLMTGARLRRNDIAFVLAEPGAELALAGAFLAGAGEHVDNQVRIEHAAPHCTSTQVFKGVAGGDGRAVFNGRIHIHPGAKQTSAELVNNNLLLSADAEIDTKPELEIYNDDVKCAHGATVGKLNETAVYYLQSRGIARADAELMISLGFVNALVDALPVPELAAWLRASFADWFAARGAQP